MNSNAEIKDVVYALIKGSPLEIAITSTGGSLYKDQRPTNSGKEDIVISVLDGLNGEFQELILNVNVYVRDLDRGNDKIENAARIKQLSRLAIDLLEEYYGNDCRLTIEKQLVLKVEGVDEHCINNKILFTQINF